MKNNNEILEPRLVVVDSYYLSVINDRIQDLSNDSEHLSMARLSHDAANTWIALLIDRLENIKNPLAQSKFGSEVSL